MRTTQFILMDMIYGDEYESISIRTVLERDLLNGELVGITILKSTAEKHFSHIRLTTQVHKEYDLTAQQVEKFLGMESLFQIDISTLGSLTA